MKLGDETYWIWRARLTLYFHDQVLHIGQIIFENDLLPKQISLIMQILLKLSNTEKHFLVHVYPA